ncbi:MAG: hypothetical protein KatS3mg010_1527 [Acidimicrobiia bacterium]|nr:MAG: hypothetical protein KatS3mg010_1527 [Acidimicrobiia bacterium]
MANGAHNLFEELRKLAELVAHAANPADPD